MRKESLGQSRRTVMRLVVVMAVAISLLIGAGVPVSAGPPVEETFDFFDFSCELTGEAGSGFVSVFSEDGSAFADALIWLPGSDPSVDEPDLFSDFEGLDVVVSGDEVSAVIPMIFAETGEPDGTLSLEGVIGDLLDEETFSDRFRDGNRWVEFTEAFQFLAATAEVGLDGEPFEASCSGTRGHVESRSTNPHAFRVDFDDAFIECFGLVGSEGSLLNLFAGEFDNEAFLNLEIFPADGDGEFEPPELFGSADIGRLSGSIDVTVPLFDPVDDEAPVTEGQVSMSIEDGETNLSDIVFQHGKVKETETELLVSGTMQITLDGRSFNLDGCFGSRFQARGIINVAQGPKMSGPPPSNDVPADARPLQIGEHAAQQTKAATLAPEVACSLIFEEEEYEGVSELPVGKTVWYTVEGTGGSMTVNTAGSNFDTILGVYTSNGEDFEQVDCVDDVFNGGLSLQAEVTFESQYGETYFIQAGGFGLFLDPEFPEFNSVPEYGLLKISVSG